MPTYSFHHVDVFTSNPLEGNALAVFPRAKGLDTQTMQRIAREMNLSETTFVFPADGEGIARVRIFTPYAEMPFAGHPTLGTAFVLREIGAISRERTSFAFEEAVGLVPVRIDDGPPFMVWLTTPPVTLGSPFENRAGVARALGIGPTDLRDGGPVQAAGAGAPFVYVPVRDAAVVDRTSLDARAIREICGQVAVGGVYVFALRGEDVYARMFAPENGIVEDPATGSAAGPLAAYLLANGLFPDGDDRDFVCEQGTAMGRRSILHVAVRFGANGRTIEVGGCVVSIVEGSLSLP